MVMLSRAAGIPARFTMGYLPGSPDGDDRVVRINDAHAWPELWFPQLGWVRFEPTPSSRSGLAPDYSLVPTDTGSTASPSASTGPSSSAEPSTAPTRNLADEELTPGGGLTDRGVVGFVVRQRPDDRGHAPHARRRVRRAGRGVALAATGAATGP